VKSIVLSSIARLSREIERFPWQERSAYADWISQTYWYVRHSTRLLAAAAGRMPFDPVSDALHNRFGAHMSEEKKHEKLCLHDLKAIGSDRLPERSSTRAFWEPQYYKVEHTHPASLMGYILVLEALASIKGPWILERVKKAHGEKSGNFIALHAEEDVDHLDKAVRAVDALDAIAQAEVRQNIEQTTGSYKQILAEISRAVRSTQPAVLAPS